MYTNQQSNPLSYKEEKNLKFGYVVTIIYVIVEYGRPQDLIPGLSLLRPGMLALLLLFVAWMKTGGIFRVKNKQRKYMIMLFVLLAIFIPFARNTNFAFAYARGFLMYIPIFLSIILYVNTFERLKMLMNVWIGLMFYICVNIVLHGPGTGSGGNFLVDENDYALLLNMMLPFSFFLFLQEKNKKKKMFYLIAAVFAIMSIIISFSRGGFIGLVCVGFIMWFYSPRKGASLVIIMIASLLIYNLAGEKYLSEMSTVTDTEQSTASERIETWKSGLNMFIAKPLGVGGGNFRVWFQDYQTEKLRTPMWGKAAHSLWIQMLTEIGIVGVTIYFLLVLANLKDIFWMKKFKNNTDENLNYAYYLSIAFIASLAGYYSSGTFISVFYYPHFYYITAFIVAAKHLTGEKVKLIELEKTSAN